MPDPTADLAGMKRELYQLRRFRHFSWGHDGS
jgi:hypothetical protein